jgi:hypothetical protein
MTGWTSDVMAVMYKGDLHLGIVRGAPSWGGPKHLLFSDRLCLIDEQIDSLEQLRHTKRPFIQYSKRCHLLSFHSAMVARTVRNAPWADDRRRSDRDVPTISMPRHRLCDFAGNSPR